MVTYCCCRLRYHLLVLTGAAITGWILLLTRIVYKREPQLHDGQLLVFSAGRGTTGTHLMFQATCLLGIPSHHWLVGCIRRDSAASTLPTNHTIPSRYTNAVRLHLELKDLVYNLSTRIDQKTRLCGNAFKWNLNALKLIQEIILDGQVSAFHDTPYPNLLGQFYKLAKQYNRNVIIISSLRDPETYVKQRLTKPYAWNDLICKERISKINHTTLIGGRFDLVTCIESALAAQASSKKKSMDLVEIFTTIRLLANAKEDGRREIATEVKDYQDAVKNVASFTIDLFERGDHTLKEDMAKMMQEKVPALTEPKYPPAQMVNWLTQERTGYDNLP